MSGTQALLSKIAALRQRLEQAQGLACEADSAAADLAGTDGSRLEVCQRRVKIGGVHDALLDVTLRPLTEVPPEEATVGPSHLTARARRILEKGRGLLGRLRTLANEVDGTASPASEAACDPVDHFYRETAAIAITTLRMVQALPEAPSAQLRLAEGLEATLEEVAHRLTLLAGVIGRRRQEKECFAAFGDLLTALAGGDTPDIGSFVALAERLLGEVQESSPLLFGYPGDEHPVAFAAGHSLTVARVMARVVLYDPDLRNRPLEPVLAALVHDVGLLAIPAEILVQPDPLDDAQRRLLESHVQIGADRVRQLLPDGDWLTDAVAGHHERLDGTGYPGGLREMHISSLARLLAVCDVYAALCCPRPYRPARETRTALTDTLLQAEQGLLDREHAERLLLLSFYPVGTAVELADGSLGVVVATHRGRRELNNAARPVVVLLTDTQGQPLAGPRPLDLAQCLNRSIVRSLSAVERRSLLGLRFPEWA
jgi:hypothetical protein